MKWSAHRRVPRKYPVCHCRDGYQYPAPRRASPPHQPRPAQQALRYSHSNARQRARHKHDAQVDDRAHRRCVPPRLHAQRPRRKPPHLEWLPMCRDQSGRRHRPYTSRRGRQCHPHKQHLAPASPARGAYSRPPLAPHRQALPNPARLLPEKPDNPCYEWRAARLAARLLARWAQAQADAAPLPAKPHGRGFRNSRAYGRESGRKPVDARHDPDGRRFSWAKANQFCPRCEGTALAAPCRDG